MKIRRAKNSDFAAINLILKSDIDYITPRHIGNDIKEKRLFVGIENENVIAILSLVPEMEYHYTAMKRLLVAEGYHGKGYAQQMIDYMSKQTKGVIGCTPWIDNAAMRHTLEKLNFHLEYIFNEKWCFYVKQV